jgi:proline iminopeptidase
MSTSASRSARERFIAFRRSLGPTPRLTKSQVVVRGLTLAVYRSPGVPGVRPLVCVNGGLLYGHSLLWPALSPLAGDRELILYDQRGRGESAVPVDVDGSTIGHDARDLVALRHALGFRSWDVLGHSWGGGIAMLAAEEDRSGIKRLVLVNSVGPTSTWLDGLHDRALARLGPTERAVLHTLDPVSLHKGDPGVHSSYSRAIYPGWFGDPELAQLIAAPRSVSAVGSVVSARLRREGYDWTRLVRGVQAEALVIHGGRDLLPTSVARELVALIARSRLELLEGAGHMPFWEAPEPFFASVQSFLRTP